MNFLFWAPLKKILKIHIAYTLSQNKPGLHTEFHENRLSRSPVMLAQADRQTKKNFKYVPLIIHVGMIYY